MKKIFKGIITGILIFSPFFCHAAFKIPLSPQNYVSDYAGILNSSQKDSLNTILKNYDVKTTNQIFVGIFDSLEGENLEDLSIRIVQSWKPGVKGKDNGVLLLIFLKDRSVRIETGYGLEPVLTDVLAKAVIEKEIAPNFKKEDYYSGINSAVSQIIKVLSGDIPQSELQSYIRENQEAKGDNFLVFLFFGLFILIFIFNIFRTLFLFSRGYSSRGWYSDNGWGGFGGGGFGGGGGGSFGGGGASGRW